MTLLRPFRAVSSLASAAAAVILIGLMLLTVLDVARRNAGMSSIHGTIDYVEIGMVLAVYLGLGKSEEVEAHVRTPLVTSRLPLPIAQWGRAIALGACALLMLYVAYSAGVRAWDSFDAGEVTAGVDRIPVWPARIAVPVGALLLAVELFARAVASATGRLAVPDAPVYEPGLEGVGDRVGERG